MRGAIPLLPLHAPMAWTGTILLMALIVYDFMRIKNASIAINAPLFIDTTYMLHVQDMFASVTHDYAVQYIKSLNWVTEAVKNATDMCGNSGIKALDVWCVPLCKYKGWIKSSGNSSIIL
jgi:hypothetical protein